MNKEVQLYMKKLWSDVKYHAAQEERRREQAYFLEQLSGCQAERRTQTELGCLAEFRRQTQFSEADTARSEETYTVVCPYSGILCSHKRNGLIRRQLSMGFLYFL